MNEHVLHAQHNEIFHQKICEHLPTSHYDWKVTALFYIAVHYLKALAKKKKIGLGTSHAEINSNIRNGTHHPKMPLSQTAYKNYMTLFHYSQDARYDGITPDLASFEEIRKQDYEHGLKCLDDFKKYVTSNGVVIPPIASSASPT